MKRVLSTSRRPSLDRSTADRPSVRILRHRLLRSPRGVGALRTSQRSRRRDRGELDGASDTHAQALYELAQELRAVEARVSVSPSDVEQSAEAFEAFEPVETAVGEELAALREHVVEQNGEQLCEIVDQYGTYEYELTDPYPGIECRPYCNTGAQPVPVPAPDAEYVGDEAYESVLEEVNNPEESSGEPEVTMPSPWEWLKGIGEFVFYAALVVGAILAIIVLAPGEVAIAVAAIVLWLLIASAGLLDYILTRLYGEE